MPYPMTPATRVRPTLTSADLIRRPNGNRLGMPAPTPTGAPVDDTFNVMPSAPRPMAASVATAAIRAPMPPAPNLAGLSGFGLENAQANAGITQPGTFAAQNAQANGTGRPYVPPQQTERANPLSGDNNYPAEGQTTAVARAPFVQRGAGVPAGQDATTPIRDTMTEDSDIASSMAGTLGRIGGAPAAGMFARKFGQPSQQSTYDSYLHRINGGN